MTGVRRPYHHESVTALWLLWKKAKASGENPEEKICHCLVAALGKAKAMGVNPEKNPESETLRQFHALYTTWSWHLSCDGVSAKM